MIRHKRESRLKQPVVCSVAAGMRAKLGEHASSFSAVVADDLNALVRVEDGSEMAVVLVSERAFAAVLETSAVHVGAADLKEEQRISELEASGRAE